MRTITTTDYTMQYPNATHFAFVPAVIHLTKVKTYTQASVVVTSASNSRSFAETREVYNGEAYFDMQRALQMCFDAPERAEVDYSKAFNDSPLKHTVRVDVLLLKNNQPTPLEAFYIDALWGNIRVGDTSGGELRRRWFINFPFSVDVFTKYGDQFDITVDDGKSDGVIFYNQEPDATGATAFRRALLAPANIFDPRPTTAKIHISLPHGIVLEDDKEYIGLTAYTLDLDRSEASSKNVYLRWVDSQGRYIYYLFKKNGDTYEYVAEEWMQKQIGVPTTYKNGLNIGGVRQSFTQGIAMTLGVRLADEHTLDYLMTLLGSPIVDMFAGYDDNEHPLWQRVNVVPSKFERTTKPLQDFNVQIVVPSLNLQSL